MKSLSLKLRDDLFTDVEEIREKLHEARNTFLNEAVEYYIKVKKRELLALKLAEESRLVKKSNREFLKDAENYDGLGGENEWN